MQSIEKLFAVVDRKVDAFAFSLDKVKGKQTGNEYYAVSAACIVEGTPFEKRVLTIGCPAGAIESIVKAILEVKKAEAKKVTLTPAAQEVVAGLKLVAAEAEEAASQPAGPRGLTLVDEDDFEIYNDENEDEDDEDDDEDDEDDVCDCEECTNSRVTLTRSASSTDAGPKKCPYCGAPVAPNFGYCPVCGGQQ